MQISTDFPMAGAPACGRLGGGQTGQEGLPCRQRLAMLPGAGQGAGQRQGAGRRQGPGHLHLTCRIWSLRLAWR